MSASYPNLDTLYLALGNAKRRSILLSIAIHPRTVSQLASMHTISFPSIHRHVRELEKAGLVHRKKVGRTNFLAIRRQGVQEAQNWLSQFQAYWGNDEETLTHLISN